MEISTASGHTVDVSNGDRNFVPRGGAKNSEHVKGHAADFHILGLSDEKAFNMIKDKQIAAGGFKLISHGPSTATEGAHLHLDPSPGPKASARFVVEVSLAKLRESICSS